MVPQLEPSQTVIFMDVLVHLKYANFRYSKCESSLLEKPKLSQSHSIKPSLSVSLYLDGIILYIIYLYYLFFKVL